jgi:uncharacterized DUF497 family protein
LGSHWDKAIARLTDDELEAVEEVVRRFDGLRNISYRKLTNRELEALNRLYKEVIEIVDE